MIRFKCNNKEFKLETYKARVVDYLYQSSDKTLALSITIGNSQKDISKLVSSLGECKIIIDKLTYECELKSSAITKIADFLMQIDFLFDCKIFGLERKIVLVERQTILNIQCAREVEAILTYKNISNDVLSNISINEWKVIQLNPNQEMVIDGVKKLVTDYKNTDFYDFPKFESGKNIIDVTGDLSKLELTLEYKERW